MGRDNHPRERRARALARKKGTRPPYDRILICCEGAKTEPLYFEDIRIEKRIPGAHVKVMPSALGTEPLQIVEYALSKFLDAREFEHIFVVFDRDQHRTYHDALNRSAALNERYQNDGKKLVKFTAIPSVPNFELWILLHFEDVLDFHHRDDIVRRVCACLPGYWKAMPGVYKATQSNVDTAIGRAKVLQSRYAAASGIDPYTEVDKVVEILRAITPAK